MGVNPMGGPNMPNPSRSIASARLTLNSSTYRCPRLSRFSAMAACGMPNLFEGPCVLPRAHVLHEWTSPHCTNAHLGSYGWDRLLQVQESVK